MALEDAEILQDTAGLSLLDATTPTANLSGVFQNKSPRVHDAYYNHHRSSRDGGQERRDATAGPRAAVSSSIVAACKHRTMSRRETHGCGMAFC
jgi:hypothetical protein